MPVRSSAEWRAGWSALRPGVDTAPVAPLSREEAAVLRLLPAVDEGRTTSSAQLILALHLDVAQIPMLESALASLQARHLAERVGVDAWRRPL